MAHIITGNKFDPNKDIPDLSGKVFIVTGGTAGIGFGITAHLLQHNAAKIILVSQKEEHAEEAKEALEKYGDTSRVHWKQCDLKDLKRTNEVAQDLLRNEKQIDGVRAPRLLCFHLTTNKERSSFATQGKVWANTTRLSMVLVRVLHIPDALELSMLIFLSGQTLTSKSTISHKCCSP